MKKALFKSTVREITGSFGRYIAILLICALGVGFFSGLKLTKNAMVHSADVYFSELSFYDYKLLSTLGFDEGSSDRLEKESIVESAEAAKSADIMVTNKEGTVLVVKTMSLPQKINKLSLKEGNMPQAKNECVADERLFSAKDIGSKIRLSEENEEEDLEQFKEKEYTIVGLVYSPLYGNHERGNTALGNGTIDGFIYIPYASYNMDYDTEIYVRVKGEHGEIYSDAYDTLIDATKDKMETVCEGIADIRYERILADAQKEIQDAGKELEEGRIDGEKELLDALSSLENGKKELADSEEAFYEAKNTISDSEKMLADKEKEYTAGKKTYNANLKKYKQGKAAYEKAKKSYDSQYAVYSKEMEEYESGKSAYDAQEAQYAEKKAQFEAGKAMLSQQQLNQTQMELEKARTMLDETKKMLETAKTQLDAAKAKLAEGKKKLDDTDKQLKVAKKQLNQAKKQLDKAPAQIAEAKKKIAAGKREIAVNETKLSDAKKELASGEQDYKEARKEFDREIADGEQKIKDAKQEMDDLKRPDTYALGREANVAYASYESDSGIVESLADVFPIFFFLVAALVCITTMTRMMEEQRTQIGVLKALGYSAGSIIAKYLAYSGSAALFGAVLGYFGGAWLFPYVIWIAYKMMYRLGDFSYVIDGRLALLSVLVAFLCSAGTTFLACSKELSEVAASLMRPKAPRAGKRVLLERVPIIWGRLKFLDKVSLRNLFRYKKRFYMMIIGISGCTALLVTGFGLKDSIANVANIQYDDIFIYDMAVTIKDAPVEVSGMSDYLLGYERSMDLSSDVLTKSVNVLVPEQVEDFSSYVVTRESSGKALAFPDAGEVMLTKDFARRLEIEVGDTVRIANNEKRSGELKVCGIFENYIGYYALISPRTYRDLFGEEPDYNTMYVNVEENTDVHTVSASLLKDDGVTVVSVCADTKDRVTNMMKSLNLVVLLVIVCAGMLAFVVIFNLNNINITERLREIATIKVLGFYRQETNSYVFRENAVLTLFGGVLGLLLGYCLHSFVMHSIHVDGVAFPQRITMLSYILSLVITLVFNQVVSLFMSGKLEQINMAESLKSVD